MATGRWEGGEVVWEEERRREYLAGSQLESWQWERYDKIKTCQTRGI